ncbi:MAG: phospholipase D family protein [Allorhizobium sp.]
MRDGTRLDRVVQPLLGGYPALSGLALIADNLHAYAMRVLSARSAGRSLDLQYYYWLDDLTGGLLAREIVAAADRGVRVRMLLDDVNIRGNDGLYRALDAHPNIEVRLFNPTSHRATAIGRGLETLIWAVRDTRRMHNKAWIADGRMAIVGGRNIGNSYFDASEQANFRDLDLAMVGPAVAQAEAVFERFWNSDFAVAIRVLGGEPVERLSTLQQQLDRLALSHAAEPYLARVAEEADVAKMIAHPSHFHWLTSVKVLCDPPEKALKRGQSEWLRTKIFPAINAAEKSVEIISPYFIPGRRGVEKLKMLVASGTQVAVLTNSLAATDVAAVHGAYAHYRRSLLRAGVKLFELRPESLRQRLSMFGSKGASLHTKAFMIDGHTCFVGSFNFDPRSNALNTEMGVFFTDPHLAAEVRAVFADQIAPDNSYRLFLKDGAVRWDGGAESPELRREPDASIWRRLAARLVGFLPIESQL